MKSRRTFLIGLVGFLGVPTAQAQQVLPAPPGLRITRQQDKWYITGTRANLSNVMDAVGRIVRDYGRGMQKPWIQISDIDIVR